MGGNLHVWGTIIFEGNFIVRGQFSGGNFSRKQFSRGNYPGAIVLEPLILQQPNFPLSALCNFVMV